MLLIFQILGSHEDPDGDGLHDLQPEDVQHRLAHGKVPRRRPLAAAAGC